MVAVVLPPGFSLRSSQPSIVSAKIFEDRIAAYWCLHGDPLGRASVEWELCATADGIDKEVWLLNNRSSLDEIPANAGIQLDEESRTAPRRKTSVFLCHSSQDKPIVRKLYARLKSRGLAPWLDEEDIIPGEEWQVAISKAVKSSDVVLVCMSTSSVSKAGFLQREIREALGVAQEQPEGSIFIIPVLLESCTMPEQLSRFQWLDYQSPNAEEKLMKALHKRASQLIR